MTIPTLDENVWAQLEEAGQVAAPPEPVLLDARTALRRAATTETLRRDVLRIRSRRRILVRAAVGVAAAAAVVATIGVVDLGGAPTPSAAAASVLTQAAARLDAVPLPGPGQYLEVRRVTVRRDQEGRRTPSEEVTQTWQATQDSPGLERVLAADGPRAGRTQDSLLLPLSRESESGGELQGLYASHPSEPTQLLATLRKLTRAEGDGTHDGTASVWQAAFGVVSDNSAPLDLKSDILRAVALLDGVAVVDRSVRIAGRSGTAVGLSKEPNAPWLVFDTSSHTYLGVVGHPETGGTWTVSTTYDIADEVPWTPRIRRLARLYKAPVPSS